ncbi:MAG: GntR family transcriptional regulator / MocR family aminotransferase [Erysipelotrichaceae bacterium]|nr:MAG: GntR family transcriptional regulator / MocR family aminotransferase [Erysipelotrichaceae bacterium]
MNMLMYDLDSKNKVPLHKQLYVFIKNDIQFGSLVPNQKLPSKRKFSEFLKISQNTIQAAYNQLIDEGYIVSVEKKGYYVSKIENIIKLDNNEIFRNKEEKSELSILFDFSINGVDRYSFPYSTWRKLYKEIINENDKTLLTLSGFQGDELLRESIAHYLHQSRGVNCSANQIIISSGTEFLVQLIIQLFDRKTVYGLENPGYEKPRLVFKANDCNIIPIEVERSTDQLG